MRVALGFVVGGLVGVFLIRALFLDPFEEIGWRIFWQGLGRGADMNWGMVLQSATFLKCLTGFALVGATAGVSVYFQQKRTQPAK
jgi:hypothetical protein